MAALDMIYGQPSASHTDQADPKCPWILRLDALPEELVSNIAHRLDCDDHCSLRLTCRAIQAKSFHEFAKEYFSEKTIMITTESLKVLAGIAESKRLRHHVHSVNILTAFFFEAAFAGATSCRCGRGSWQPTVRNTEAYRTYVLDQTRLKASADDKRFLTDAFQKLHRIRNLHFADCVSAVETSSDVVGMRKVTRKTNADPILATSAYGKSPEYKKWQSHVWQITLQALGKSRLDNLVRFGALTGKSANTLAIDKDFRLSTRLRLALITTFKNLKSLTLMIRAQTAVLKRKEYDIAGNDRAMKRLARIFPSLDELKLSFDSLPETLCLFDGFTLNLDLSKIVTLSISGLYTTAEALAATLSRCRTLQVLKIEWSNLMEGSWTLILEFLQQLGQLNHLHLMYLAECENKAFFLEQNEILDDFDDGFGLADMSTDGGGPSGSASGQDMSISTEDAASDATILQDPSMSSMPTSSAGTTVPPCAEDQAGNYGANSANAEDEDFIAPGHESHGERGYYACLESAQKIAQYLPIFLKEYNTGDSIGDPLNPFGNIMGMPIAIPLPPLPLPSAPAPGGTTAGTGQQGNIPVLNAQQLSNMLASVYGGGPLPEPPPNVGGNATTAGGGQNTAAQNNATDAVVANHGPDNNNGTTAFTATQPTAVATGPPGTQAAPSHPDNPFPFAYAGGASDQNAGNGSTTAAHDFPASAGGSGQHVGGGAANPDSWMLEDEEAVFTDAEDEID